MKSLLFERHGTANARVNQQRYQILYSIHFGEYTVTIHDITVQCG